MKIYFTITLLIVAFALVTGCKKFLDEKPNAKLDIPTTLADFQALVDYYPYITNSEPSAGDISSDDYYLFDADYNALALDANKRMYTWQKDNIFPLASNDWYTVYRPVFTANTILDNIGQIQQNAGNLSDYNNVKGEAFYIRGKAFLKVSSIWTAPYDPANAASQLGIPLRLTSDFNKQSVRASLKDTYIQIIADLSMAAGLLPATPLQVTRPSKPAAFALLARTYLYMGNYSMAGLYADSCLKINSMLMDYNTLSTTAAYPFARFNKEVIQDNVMPVAAPLANTRARIDTNLYKSYGANDLRKTLFFKASTNGSQVFKGSYEGNASYFAGIATDELLLIRAECAARAGNMVNALNDLNTLLTTRFKKGTFVPVTAPDAPTALSVILVERRKELLFRGLRFSDLKRYNKDGQNINLKRVISGVNYNLPPNDLRYALPIPDDIIQLTGMAQNPR